VRKNTPRRFDFLPLSIRLETRGGVATPLVLRGTPLPTKRSQIFSTASDNQSGVEIKISFGESPNFANNIALGNFHLEGIPPAKKGVPQIKVEFSVDNDCEVLATATIPGSTVSHRQKFEPPEGLTDDFIEKAIFNAQSTRVADEEFLRQTQAQDRATSLIAKAEEKLEMSPNARFSTAIADLGLALASGSSTAIRTKSDELETLLSETPDPFDIFAQVFSPKPQRSNAATKTHRPPAAAQRVDTAVTEEVAPAARRQSLGKIFGAGTFTLDPQLCFVLMPFANDLQPIYDDHIRPTIERAQMRCERADEIKGPTLITWDIWERVNRARFLVADLTNQNPNVFYELGLAHAISKDVILLTQSMDFVPFDLKTLRCIEYEFTPRGMQRLEKDLAGAIGTLIKVG
jgi:hypothetical protein